MSVMSIRHYKKNTFKKQKEEWEKKVFLMLVSPVKL